MPFICFSFIVNTWRWWSCLVLNVWSTAADERVDNYFQQSETFSANHFTVMRSKSEPNFSRKEPKRQQFTVTLIYTSLIERILPRDAHSQRNYGNVNPDLHLIKTSSLNRDILIYNSHRSDPTSQWELAEATQIFCSKDVAHFGLVSTKSWVFAAECSAIFAIFIWTSLSKEQAK